MYLFVCDTMMDGKTISHMTAENKQKSCGSLVEVLTQCLLINKKSRYSYMKIHTMPLKMDIILQYTICNNNPTGGDSDVLNIMEISILKTLIIPNKSKHGLVQLGRNINIRKYVLDMQKSSKKLLIPQYENKCVRNVSNHLPEYKYKIVIRHEVHTSHKTQK